MAGLLVKGVFKGAKLATKYVVIPVLYAAFLGYLMQEAADRIRNHDPEDGDASVEPMLQPSR